ncbi:SAVED domain-containing protein [Myxococcus sp. K15C18031901]|uniref:SAVED domain-containing protein n=1 Tax=Myxococcus dinghuensis TaxID=2906761 RepID=UPI0020A71F53|nr:SAVED domain-containing protein [Myxococcus dinghuensis]MCP3099296.1 SAVED domain-containing protein [Myxococcus dinghuensis]
MAEPRILTIELGRVENLDRPTEFDEKPQLYFARGPYGKLGVARFPWDEVESLRDAFRQCEPPEVARRQMGALLLRFLQDVLKGTTGWSGYESALLDAQGTTPTPCLLRFRFSASELFSLPWAVLELDRYRSLGSIQPYPVSFEWASNHPAPAEAARSGRTLFAWAEPMGLDPVGVDAHLRALRDTCPGFDPKEDVLEDMDQDALRDTLRRARDEGRPFQVLHILCHGSEKDGAFGLVWNAPYPWRVPEVVMGERIRAILAPFKEDLQVVILSACHGGDPGRPGRMFGGVAHDIHQLGFPGVIASLMPLSVDGSVLMSRAFHEAFSMRKTSIREAYQAAHAALPLNTSDWASLQLFMPAPSEEKPLRGERILFEPEHPPRMPDEVAVAYEVNFNVAEGSIHEALVKQDAATIPTLVLQPFGRVDDGLPATPVEWRRAFKQAEQLVNAMGPEVSRMHLFGRAPLPLMFHLGWLTQRLKLRAYQEQRGRNGIWDCGYDAALPIPKEGRFFTEHVLPDKDACRAAGNRLALLVEVNQVVSPEAVTQWLGAESPMPLMRLRVARGISSSALESEQDGLRALEEFRKCLDDLHENVSDVSEVWLAMACPASLAAVLGRAYNRKTQPALRLFNFRKGEGYREVHLIGHMVRHPPRDR